MNHIARCDWLPERARWSHLSRSGLPAVSRKKHFPESHVVNLLLTKLVRSRWLNVGLVLFCEFMDLDFVSVYKQAKKKLGQYPAILTSHLVNDPITQNYIFSCLYANWWWNLADERARISEVIVKNNLRCLIENHSKWDIYSHDNVISRYFSKQVHQKSYFCSWAICTACKIFTAKGLPKILSLMYKLNGSRKFYWQVKTRTSWRVYLFVSHRIPGNYFLMLVIFQYFT